VKTNFWLKLLFLSIYLVFLSVGVHGQETLVLSDGIQEYIINDKNYKVFKDSTNKIPPKDILNYDFDMDKVDFSDLSWKNSSFWIKIKVRNNSNENRWLLEILDFGIQNITFYDIENNSSWEAGYLKPFHSRSYAHKNFVYAIDIPKDKEKIYLLKINSETAFGPVMEVQTDKHFFSYSNKEYIVLGLYYGLLIFIASYNFFLYLSIRDKSHLYYIVYVLAIALRTLEGNGIGFQYLWFSFPQFNHFLYFAPELLLLSFAAYTITFLELRKQYKVYYNIIFYSLAFYFILFGIDKFFVIPYLFAFYLITFIIIYSISFLVYKKGFKPARYFILGYSLLILSQISYFFFLTSNLYGIQLENAIIILLLVYSINIGFVIEVFIFSIAMADKIKLFKVEKETVQQQIIDQLKLNEELKDKVNRELEYKVKERTVELETTKLKLQEQTEIINQMNQLLDKENFSLKSNMKEINKERGLLKALSYEEFSQTFPDENSCYRFMEDLKWNNGYVCKKCGNDKFSKSTSVFSRKCSKCDYIETIKANTIFHNIKFPIEKAFGLIYLTLTSEGEVSTYELAEKLKLQQKTCWSFRQKILDKIKKEHISKKDLTEKGWSILIKE